MNINWSMLGICKLSLVLFENEFLLTELCFDILQFEMPLQMHERFWPDCLHNMPEEELIKLLTLPFHLFLFLQKCQFHAQRMRSRRCRILSWFLKYIGDVALAVEWIRMDGMPDKRFEIFQELLVCSKNFVKLAFTMTFRFQVTHMTTCECLKSLNS